MTITPITDSASLLAPFEGRWSTNALIDDVIESLRDQVCVSYIKSTDPFEWQHITGADLDRCIRAATAYYADRIGVRNKDQTCRQVSLLSDSSFDLLVAQIALMRLGYGVVLISPNNSVPAIVHLLKATSSVALIRSPEKKSEAEQARDLLMQEQDAELKLAELCPIERAIAHDQLPPSTTKKDPYRSDVPYEQQANEPAVTLHSSGSTGFPKPYTYTHEVYVVIIADYMPYDALCTAPVYHGFGCAVAWRQLIHHRRLYLYTGTMRHDLVSRAVRDSTIDIIYAVPFTFKILSEDKDSLATLCSMKICCYSGAPCPIEVGDMLVANGVNLVAFLGATEVGQIMDSIRDFDTDKGWNVMRPSKRVDPYLKFENVGTTEEGPYEMVCIKGWKGLSKVNRPDGSYASGDHYRIIRNDDGSLRGYVYLGRGDDTIVHLNGEKTNPVPMEQSIKSSPLLRDCLVFGSGQPCTGALIIPYEHAWEPHASSSHAERQLALKKQIEPLLREVNSQCPSHSRLVPEMILFLRPQDRFPTADKGSVKRSPANSMFAENITQLYTEFDLGTSTPEQDKTLIESQAQLKPLLKSILERFIELTLDGKEDVDLTTLGVDSVMDSQIRSLIHRSIRMQSPLSNTVVFQHPTLNKLTLAVYEHIQGSSANGTVNGAVKKQQEAATRQMLADLRSELKPRDQSLSDRAAQGEKEIIVLTGATGSLGAHILDQLRRKATVAKVFCLNRAADHADAAKRTDESLEARGLPPLKDGQGAQIVSLAADISKPDLGLSESEFDEIAGTVTCVVHNGWPVNFNLSVESFQAVLEGSVQLMNLAGQSTGTRSPRFLFSSSISVAFNTAEPLIPETILDHLDHTHELGYAHSKWIVENLCRDAGTLIGGGFESVVMRIGQMVGDRSKGIWNETEAPPLIIKSAQTVGCLPGQLDDLYWLPVDVAGLIAAQLTNASISRDCELVHVVSDAAMPWNLALKTLAEPQNLGDSFEVVPYAEWLERLEKSDRNVTRNPAVKLLEHYRSLYKEMQRRKSAPANFETTKLKAVLASSPESERVVDGLAAYKPEYLTTTVAAWKRSGFLK
ncbi:Male sterility, NAD-binding [Kalmanozyma brasiliensis GHG001]|uniref:Carrier domain-containing protein n=1 Tax=Kalmanozyma brasiliensis (strain GHG001) TaxID=1365824 RepID=V5ERK8_KALBG|nr:Male sterility, NAD-binding [Kalmanozyma brasiliensis GHG001]EST07780.1 Male sterility, NAD-binding [Kalmanozyma brasiliensis GHG001]